MREWSKTTLGNVCDEVGGVIQTGPFGSQLHRSDYTEEGTPVVMPKDILEGQIITEGIARIGSEHVRRLSKHKLSAGDIVYGRRGDIGRQALISIKEEGWLCGTGCLRISLGETVLNPKFLHYYLRQQEVIAWITNQAVGATMPNLNTGILRSIPICFPPLPIQRRIADILSAYDELIENNQRRIKILEEMARGLYREWFVKFHFPGHKSVPLVESELGPIPEGWEIATLGSQLASLESGSRPKGGVGGIERGIPSIGAENINGIGYHNFESEKFIPGDFFDSMCKGVVHDRDVALYKDGAYIGKSSYFRDGFPHEKCAVNEHVFLLRTHSERLDQNALYLWLCQPDTVSAIRAKNANAAQPGINQKTVRSLDIIVPSPHIAGKFDSIVEPMLSRIATLAKINQNLRRTRDLLLPRLMSGKVDLEELEI